MTASAPVPDDPEAEAFVREQARIAAKALRDALDGEAARMEGRPDAPPPLTIKSKAMASGRPHHWHMYEFNELPGIRRTVALSTRSPKGTQASVTFTHELLDGWVYDRGEIGEMLEDLDRLAAGLGWPTAPTRNDGTKPTKAAMTRAVRDLWALMQTRGAIAVVPTWQGTIEVRYPPDYAGYVKPEGEFQGIKVRGIKLAQGSFL